MNEIDQFSKCFSYEKLKEDINDKVLNHRGGHILSCRYLCVDIDDFQSYLDYYGYGQSDSRLVLLAKQIRELVKPNKVYRHHGGDSYIAEYNGEDLSVLNIGEELKLKHSIVSIAFNVPKSRHHRISTWILYKLDEGVVKATLQGSFIECKEPEFWKNR